MMIERERHSHSATKSKCLVISYSFKCPITPQNATTMQHTQELKDHFLLLKHGNLRKGGIR